MSYDGVPAEDSRDERFVPDPLAQAAESGLNAVLRSVGSLLITLGGAQRPARRRRRSRSASTPTVEQGPMPAELPEPALPEPPRFEGVSSSEHKVELVLSDARERAHQVIEESVEQARQLLIRRGSDAQTAQLQHLGESVDTLAREVGSFRGAVDGRLAAVEQRVVDVERSVVGVYNRLDRIELLLGAIARGESGSSGPIRPAEQSTPTRRTSPAEPRPRLAATRPEPVAPLAPLVRTPPPAEPMESASSTATPPPLRSAAPVEPLPSAISPMVPVNPAETRFDPAGGALVVRIFPISGFQGLMRVQDALAHVATIRAATVETSAQGEARLRLQLGASIASVDLARGIEARLGQRAAVRAASIADRNVLIVLE